MKQFITAVLFSFFGIAALAADTQSMRIALPNAGTCYSVEIKDGEFGRQISKISKPLTCRGDENIKIPVMDFDKIKKGSNCEYVVGRLIDRPVDTLAQKATAFSLFAPCTQK